jgi:hypothetical protein
MILSLFFSVFVVACNIIQSLPTPGTATNALPITLTLRHPRGPTPTPSPIIAQTPILVSSESAPADAVAFEGLRCYALLGAGSMCLGSIRNLSDTSLRQIAVTLRVDGESGADEQTIWIEQQLLPPGESAPYRALWAQPVVVEDAISVSLARAQPSDASDRYADVRVVNARGRLNGGRYTLSATLHNEDDVAAMQVRAILTVRAPDGGVAGYRVAQVAERLDAGAMLTVEIELIPQQPRDDLRPTLHVEAVLASVGQ